MITKTKAARGSGNYNTRQNVRLHKDAAIITDYERGALIAGIIIAIAFGLAFVHAAVVL